ncbi:MAG: response regulator [Betaproteobacteria bacterium]|nr:response regulator [Betaproteobacteria bacterium]MDE2622570.1 response regulator [Betaproteobacteria bacterium]
MNDFSAQGVFNIRRDYNSWVATESLEDYALRYAPESFRKWSIGEVAKTAFSTSSFMVLEAIGATLLIHSGFVNSFCAIVCSALILLLVSLPISYYSARHNLDMDLLTRGSGFGYLGSTITSLIYAAFTFIFFAFEAAIMAYAVHMAFRVPMALAYVLCAIVVIPVVTGGITAISRFQSLTQPLWLVLLALPYFFLLKSNFVTFHDIWRYNGIDGGADGFNIRTFCIALTVLLPLLAQMGEQADYLRFMPAMTAGNRKSWYAGVLAGGSGWVILSSLKILGGMVLAYVALRMGYEISQTLNPNALYFIAYQYVFSNYWVILLFSSLLIILSQLKINVTNAYAGSLAWSNFFSRLTHSHPGRVVWVIFNIVIALMLMELNLLQVMDRVLGLFSNIAVPWIMTVFTDLMINKPMGLSPRSVEFKRAYLYDINPVGFLTVTVTAFIAIIIYLGGLGERVQPFAILVSLLLPLILTPLIAWWTKGRFYIARPPDLMEASAHSHECTVCGNHFESEDVAVCPAYRGKICSLCCTLDVRCQDQCKPSARISVQMMNWTSLLLPPKLINYLKVGLGHYIFLMISFSLVLVALLGLLYYQEVYSNNFSNGELVQYIRGTYIRVFSGLFVISGIVAWWLVLVSKSRQVALMEAKSQTELLMHEINSHKKTDKLLQNAKVTADSANLAKSRYIMSISHELRTPLNSILGYAQIMDGDPGIPDHRKQAVSVIRRSGEHLLSLIEGTLDIARIESGKLKLDIKPLPFRDLVQQIVSMFRLQAQNKGLDFIYQPLSELPVTVRGDSGRLRQILINILGNAIKFTREGRVVLRIRYQNEIATVEVEDTGPGISASDLERIFDPFARGSNMSSNVAGGTGLGLTISKMLIDLMGGDIHVDSTEGKGSVFRMRLFLPHVIGHAAAEGFEGRTYLGYHGPRRRILVVDNESLDRSVLSGLLTPLGFDVFEAGNGHECLELLDRIHPDLVMMDLAMPGIDGWETIRRIRQTNHRSVAVIVVSANAFEKNTDNDVEITPDRFITKPININELLECVGRSLSISWVFHDKRINPLSVPQGPMTYPPRQWIHELSQHADAGYLKGIFQTLDRLRECGSDYYDFVEAARRIAGLFQFEELKILLKKASESRVGP